jgi:hypothetical protein
MVLLEHKKKSSSVAQIEIGRGRALSLSGEQENRDEKQQIFKGVKT